MKDYCQVLIDPVCSTVANPPHRGPEHEEGKNTTKVMMTTV